MHTVANDHLTGQNDTSSSGVFSAARRAATGRVRDFAALDELTDRPAGDLLAYALDTEASVHDALVTIANELAVLGVATFNEGEGGELNPEIASSMLQAIERRVRVVAEVALREHRALHDMLEPLPSDASVDAAEALQRLAVASPGKWTAPAIAAARAIEGTQTLERWRGTLDDLDAAIAAVFADFPETKAAAQ